MRILFTSFPDKPHLRPMLPLAWALRTAGHDVRVASQPSYNDVITQAGLTAVPVGGDRDAYRLFDAEEFARTLPDRDEEPGVWEGAPEKLGWDEMTEAYANAVIWWHKPDNFPMIAGLVDFARHWQPDLIIWEPVTYAGAIAAKACGAAHARFMNTVDVFGLARDHYLRLRASQPVDNRADPMAKWLGAYATKYGAEFSEDMITGQFTIDHFPSCLRREANVNYVRMRYVPYGGPAVVPKWLWIQPERPRVALTLGLVASERFTGYPVNVQDILDALADLDIEIVATIADKERPTVSRVPDNTRIVPYAPLDSLVPTCAAVIHHAGGSTMCTTTLYGAPQLALPWAMSEPQMARSLAEHGAGLMVHSSVATGQIVRDNLLRLLNEPSFRETASRLRDEMLALPSPNQIVHQLEELTTKHRASTPTR